MEPTETQAAAPGLRERKKQRTRETIERVALELFAERGYEHTTLAEIADAADVSPRTIFSYFESKEDILFCHEPDFYDRLKQALDQRPPGANTIDAIREFILEMAPPDEQALLRKRILQSSEELKLAERARSGRLVDLITESIAKDLDAGPGDLRPHLVAASMTAAFTTMSERITEETGSPVSFEHARSTVDEVLDFVRAGLEALQRR